MIISTNDCLILHRFQVAGGVKEVIYNVMY